jgi:opacity protein-like surface antigen
MKRIFVLAALLVCCAASTAFAQSTTVVSAGYNAIDGAHATIHLVAHVDGSLTGSGKWIYPDHMNNVYIEIDQWELSVDGKAVYLSGEITFAGFSGRYVVKLIDNGEGKNASEPDRESFVVFNASPTWNLDNPFARQLIDDPTLWGLTEWFPILGGNIQVHKSKN